MLPNIRGSSSEILSVLDKVSNIAKIDRPVLILGERGTGKELVAQRLHYLSQRWDQPLVSMNCSALSEGLVDSELFGHESGAFTGANKRHQGRFERAEGGSLFLDELGTMPLNVQEKLLRVIEYGQYERVGGSSMINTDVRLICATNVDLLEASKTGQFRADLLDRLAFDVIHLPPLRYRKDDILELAEHFAFSMCRELGLSHFEGFSHIAVNQLLDHHWPGNVRELKNVVERAVYQHGSHNAPIQHITLNPFVSPWSTLCSEAVDTKSPDVDDIRTQQPTLTSPSCDDVDIPDDLKQWLKDHECHWLQMALAKSQFNQRQAAKLLGLSYDQIRGLVRKHQITNAS
ncbi:phage shock protein operon transcriptional activator [Vibrio agarivorans]|uniref:Phage shock protein operon transcriptional activator n=1 Tax=Vibrio agarivorans TaxID=153622 RepID=A0ABT7XYU1_9VIBR|nr:phage shock protein operon transcriptional activator [Vibrio agarivorans]MDN2480931.1 phage shock protein operon transcriptional activator [Vibrio agarivorans]